MPWIASGNMRQTISQWIITTMKRHSRATLAMLTMMVSFSSKKNRKKIKIILVRHFLKVHEISFLRNICDITNKELIHYALGESSIDYPFSYVRYSSYFGDAWCINFSTTTTTHLRFTLIVILKRMPATKQTKIINLKLIINVGELKSVVKLLLVFLKLEIRWFKKFLKSKNLNFKILSFTRFTRTVHIPTEYLTLFIEQEICKIIKVFKFNAN